MAFVPPSYSSSLTDMRAVSSPKTGRNGLLSCLGFFDFVPPSSESTEGHLSKTKSNVGRIISISPSELISFETGAVSMTIRLPYAIEDGVYGGLPESARYAQHMVLWATHHGEHYISSPGILAALTPSGVLFEVWTNLGRHQLFSTNVNVAANTFFEIKFAWNKDGFDEGWPSTMAIFVDGILVGHRRGDIAETSIDGIFSVLDSPSGKFGAVAEIKRLELYPSFSEELPAYVQSSSSSVSSQSIADTSSSSMSYDDDFPRAGKATIGFDFYVGAGSNTVVITDISYHVVSQKTIDLNAVGPIGAALNETGGPLTPSMFPEPPEDIPPGITQTRERS